MSQRAIKRELLLLVQHCDHRPESVLRDCVQVVSIYHTFGGHAVFLGQRYLGGNSSNDSCNFGDRDIATVRDRAGEGDYCKRPESRIASEFSPTTLRRASRLAGPSLVKVSRVKRRPILVSYRISPRREAVLPCGGFIRLQLAVHFFEEHTRQTKSISNLQLPSVVENGFDAHHAEQLYTLQVSSRSDAFGEQRPQ